MDSGPTAQARKVDRPTSAPYSVGADLQTSTSSSFLDFTIDFKKDDIQNPGDEAFEGSMSFTIFIG